MSNCRLFPSLSVPCMIAGSDYCPVCNGAPLGLDLEELKRLNDNIEDQNNLLIDDILII
ncbi:hypothetical protein [Sigmofec virus UA08Rod_5448]|uniref:Uncharacterized protein n=1 Tax=Sigmofec virus UA08Rod_5448 TaxID=2929425 RepID=A0A976N1G3_9VIRU|nr:hypothetical protein [Sigmofec virus UA08Rod_5448]